MTPTPLSEQFPWVAQTIQAVGNGRNTDAVLAKTPSALRGGVQALAFHVLRQWAWAYAVVPRLASKKPDAELKVWLVCGVALLREPRRYDPHTVVDQVVQACKQNHRLKAKAPFVNACLRRLVREYDALDQAVCNEPEVRFNHPTWWIEKLQAQYPDHWEEALQCNQTAAPMVLRVNPAHHSAQSYQALLLSEMALQSVTVGPHGLLLAKPLPVTQLPGFGAGHVSVQDASPQLAAALVWQSPLLREKVAASAPVALLDACAAPGGKTAHLLEMGQRIKADQRVTALEPSPKRAVRITDTLTRLNLAAFADVVVADGKHTAGCARRYRRRGRIDLLGWTGTEILRHGVSGGRSVQFAERQSVHRRPDAETSGLYRAVAAGGAGRHRPAAYIRRARDAHAGEGRLRL